MKVPLPLRVHEIETVVRTPPLGLIFKALEGSGSKASRVDGVSF